MDVPELLRRIAHVDVKTSSEGDQRVVTLQWTYNEGSSVACTIPHTAEHDVVGYFEQADLSPERFQRVEKTLLKATAAIQNNADTAESLVSTQLILLDTPGSSINYALRTAAWTTVAMREEDSVLCHFAVDVLRNLWRTQNPVFWELSSSECRNYLYNSVSSAIHEQYARIHDLESQLARIAQLALEDDAGLAEQLCTHRAKLRGLRNAHSYMNLPSADAFISPAETCRAPSSQCVLS